MQKRKNAATHKICSMKTPRNRVGKSHAFGSRVVCSHRKHHCLWLEKCLICSFCRPSTRFPNLRDAPSFFKNIYNALKSLWFTYPAFKIESHYVGSTQSGVCLWLFCKTDLEGESNIMLLCFYICCLLQTNGTGIDHVVYRENVEENKFNDVFFLTKKDLNTQMTQKECKRITVRPVLIVLVAYVK